MMENDEHSVLVMLKCENWYFKKLGFFVLGQAKVTVIPEAVYPLIESWWEDVVSSSLFCQVLIGVFQGEEIWP